MRRRDFLKLGGGLLAAAAVPSLGFAANRPRVLVLLELRGGNDSLNAFIPYADPAYYKARPKIALKRDQVIALDERMGLNPALKPLMPAWRRNELALVRGLGYPQPNRSHFRSIEIWDTGSESDEYLDSGWLARVLAAGDATAGNGIDAVVLGHNAAPLSGAGIKAVAMQNVQHFIKRVEKMRRATASTGNPALAHILSVQQEMGRAGMLLKDRLVKRPLDTGRFPKHPLGQHFAEAARLIVAEAPVAVIKLSHGSFDTHVAQPNRQARLLKQMAETIGVFREVMIEQGRWNDVMLMSYSEFGRRVAENASKGTDHGTAATHFLMGGGVRGGLHGAMPSLVDLDRGDLRYTVDFRRLYNTVTTRWLARPGLYPAASFPPLDVVRV